MCWFTTTGFESTGKIGANGVLVSATTGKRAGPSLNRTDARAMETEAPKLGCLDGVINVGTGLGHRVAAVTTANASGTETLNVGPNRRNCTRQVAYVVRYMSATDRHNAR